MWESLLRERFDDECPDCRPTPAGRCAVAGFGDSMTLQRSCDIGTGCRDPPASDGERPDLTPHIYSGRHSR